MSKKQIGDINDAINIIIKRTEELYGLKKKIDDITEDLEQEQAFREGCEAIIEKFWDKMDEINNLCVEFQESGTSTKTDPEAWDTIKKIYDLSLMPERKGKE